MSTKIRYYYHRNSSKKPVITICLLIDTDNKKVIARGVAICSTKENSKKSFGRSTAFERANRAVCKQENSLPIVCRDMLDHALEVLSFDEVSKGVFDYKSCVNPIITKYEEQLLLKALPKSVEQTEMVFNRSDVVILNEDDGEID